MCVKVSDGEREWGLEEVLALMESVQKLDDLHYYVKSPFYDLRCPDFPTLEGFSEQLHFLGHFSVKAVDNLQTNALGSSYRIYTINLSLHYYGILLPLKLTNSLRFSQIRAILTNLHTPLSLTHPFPPKLINKNSLQVARSRELLLSNHLNDLASSLFSHLYSLTSALSSNPATKLSHEAALSKLNLQTLKNKLLLVESRFNPDTTPIHIPPYTPSSQLNSQIALTRKDISTLLSLLNLSKQTMTTLDTVITKLSTFLNFNPT